MDSLMSVELKRRLERGLGAPLPSTLAFNYPNIRALAGFVLTLLLREETAVQAPAAEPETTLDDIGDDEVARRLRALIEATS
jgi:hypothetical protein